MQFKHRIWCETDQKYEYDISDSDISPTACPTDSGHVINTESICITSEVCVPKYEIQTDVSETTFINKDFLSINYKSELADGKTYTPEFIICQSGANAGQLEKTDYYRDYVDANDKGTLVLTVEEVYVNSSDAGLYNTAQPVILRTKIWKHTDISSQSFDEVNIKSKIKLYNTRRKRHIEGIKRRENVVEQLIDHVGLAGVLSGAFAGPDDAYNKLTALQELHSEAFGGWINSGRGSLIDVVGADTITTWFDTIIPDNGTTQAMIPWMIGLDFREYIQDKLKGLVV